MTDIRCPACGHAFFNKWSQPSTDNDHERYECGACGHSVVLPTTPTPDFPTDRFSEQTHSVVACLHCDATHLPFIWSGNSMDGDRDHAYECPDCTDYLYHVRVSDPETSTGTTYADENPFAMFAGYTVADYAGHPTGPLPDDQTRVSEWSDSSPLEK